MTWRCITTLKSNTMKHGTQCLFLCRRSKYVKLLDVFRWGKDMLHEHDLWAIKEGKKKLSDFLPRVEWEDINGDTDDLRDFSHWMPVPKPKKK